MRVLIVCAAVVVFALAASASAPDAAAAPLHGVESEPTAPTADALAELEAVVQQHDVVLTAFVHPDNTKCTELDTDFLTVAERMAFFMAFVRVDCAKEPAVQQAYNVTKFPTLLLMRKNQTSIEYTGPLVANDIVFFALQANYERLAELQRQKVAGAEQNQNESKLNFGAVELSTAAQVASYTDYHDVTVLGVFSSKDDPAAKVFSTAATTFTSRQDMGFAAVYSSKMASMLGASETPAIRLSTKDGKLLSYSGNFTSKVKITRWVSMNGVILLKKFDDSKLISVMNGSPALFFFHTAETMESSMKQLLEEIASEFTDVIEFYSAHFGSFETYAKQLGFHDKQDSIAIIYPQKKRHYTFKETTIDADTIRNFCGDFIDEKLQPALRSAKFNKDQTGPVLEIVSANFAEIVGDINKDVIVEFCRQGTSECALMHNLIDQLGETLKTSANATVVRIDVDENEISAFVEMDHVPQLILFTAQNKTGVAYNGAGALPDILEFVANHSTYPIKYVLPEAAPKPNEKEDPVKDSKENMQRAEEQALEHLSKTLF